MTTYSQWVRDGRPFKQCQPALDLRATLGRRGYTGPATGYPDTRHQVAYPPEDHCPYSATPWPGAQPYPYCMAIDFEAGFGLDYIDLGTRLVFDKGNGVPGTEPIKYINWTDVKGNTWDEVWEPTHHRVPSTDRGHVHVSFRTDYVTSHSMASYDPYRDKEANVKLLHNIDDGAYWLTNGTHRYWLRTQNDLVNALAAWGLRTTDAIQVHTADLGAYGINADLTVATPPTAGVGGNVATLTQVQAAVASVVNRATLQVPNP